MTAGAPAQTSRRPRRPRLSWQVPVAVVGFLALTYWAGSERWGIGFLPMTVLENLTRGAGILAEFWPPHWGFLPRTVDPFIETFQMAVIETAVGCGVALPVAFLASKVTSPNTAVFLADKGLLNVVRSLPDLLYALVFVAAIGIGPLGGILALILFNIGVTAKLLSETVDGVDVGPIEAAQAVGAGRLQTTVRSVLPQVLPNYTAYSLYVFELNIRASTVIGLVGAGGIGQLLIVEMRFFNYANVMVVILMIFVIVFAIELVSQALRRRLV